MIKKKKIALFRELYHEIETLLESYFYKDVAVILRKKHGLEVTAGTLKNYVFQHRQHRQHRQHLRRIAIQLENVESNPNNNVDHSCIDDGRSSEIENDLSMLENKENSATAKSEKMSLADLYASLGKERLDNGLE